MTRHDERLLAVGGVHALDGTEPCQLSHVNPEQALEDLHWKDALVVRAHGEGTAEITCGSHHARLRLVQPARLGVVLVDAHVVVGQRFQVRAVAYDGNGRELEIGKWTEIAWRADGPLAIDNDKSAGEFGLCDTCFGAQGFRASTAGDGTIEARLGTATGVLKITAQR